MVGASFCVHDDMVPMLIWYSLIATYQVQQEIVPVHFG